MARGLKPTMNLLAKILSLLFTLQFGKYNVAYGQGSFITIPALGRMSELGNLYDERSGQFTQDYMFTSKQSTLSYVTTEKISDTTKKSAVTINVSDTLKFFELDLNTAVNIISGLTQPTGSAEMLQIKNTLRNNTVSGLFMTTCETVRESLPLFKPGLKEFIAPSSPISAKATHVVTRVTWGVRTVVSLASGSTNYTEKLPRLLNHLEKLLNGPQNSSELGDGDDNDFSVYVYTDAPQQLISMKPMYNLSEAHEILHQMPLILQHLNGGKGIPLEYTLSPLSTVREYLNKPKTAGVVFYPTPDVFILEIIDAVEDIHSVDQELQKVLSELSLEPICTNPSTVHEVISLKTSFENAVAMFLQQLNSALVEARSGKIRTSNLYDLLTHFKDSEFSHENVPHLLAEFDQRLESMKFCIDLQNFYPDIEYIGTGQGFTLLNTINQSTQSNETIYILYKTDELVLNERSAWKENVHTLLKVLDQPYNTRLIVDCDSAAEADCEGVDAITLRQIKNATVTIENVIDELKTEMCLPNGQTVLNLCNLHECKNEAACKLSPDFTDFICSCPTGFTGRMCEIKVGECWNDGVPCSNIGKCEIGDESGLFSCSCSTGYTGQYCDINIDDCFADACSNGGTCIDEINTFRCECSSGFKGTFCEVNIDDCSPGSSNSVSLCLHGGTCHDQVNSYSCLCAPGYEGQFCEIATDHCPIGKDPCLNGGSCTSQINSYACICSQGYSGSNCEIDIDDCNKNALCINGGSCIDEVNTYRCACAGGYTGTNCEINVDECAVEKNNCSNGGTCVDELNNFTCYCTAGYTGRRCETNIDDCVGNTRCYNSGTCMDGINSYSCACLPGFSGENCEINIDECAGSARCSSGGTCLDGINTYTCLCPRGFTGRDCDGNINECVGNDGCYNGGTCLDGVASYSCKCAEGFTGTNCEVNVDDCAGSGKCSHGGICVDGVSSFTCHCPPGYTGRQCDSNINECIGNDGCYNGGLCIDGVNSYSCNCAAGYTGSNCEVNVDDCAGRNMCLNFGTCTDQVNSYTCICSPGYTGNYCEINVDDCHSNDICFNGGTCIDGINTYRCICATGYEGLNCEINVNDCAGKTKCHNGGTCVDGVRGFTCYCAPGCTGTDCNTLLNNCGGINYCYNGATCISGINSYSCACDVGFTGKSCETNIDDCVEKCRNGGTCVDRNNDFTCYCLPGYTGRQCNTNVDECAGANRCYNGGTCVDLVNGYTCTCNELTHGAHCEHFKKKFLSGIGVVYTNDARSKPDHSIEPMEGWNADINAGFGGEFVWLVPEWTTDSTKGVTGIEVIVQDREDTNYRDLAKGAGGYFRYLKMMRSHNSRVLISKVRLWRTSDSNSKPSKFGWKNWSGDINWGRGGDHLYICWETTSV